MRESTIERYLCFRVKDAGGEIRKVKFVGHRGAPDRQVLLEGKHPLVELKRPTKRAAAHQEREHERLRRAGFEVYVLDTMTAVDRFMFIQTGRK